MTVKANFAMLALGQLAVLIAPAAWAAGRTAADVTVVVDKTTGQKAAQGTWGGFDAKASNYIVIQGPGMADVKVTVEGEGSPLVNENCSKTGIPNLQVQLTTTCAKLEHPLRAPYKLRIISSDQQELPVELKDEAPTARPDPPAGGDQPPGGVETSLCRRQRDAVAEAVKRLAGTDGKWATKWTPDASLCGTNVYDDDKAVLLFDEQGEYYDSLPKVDEDDTIAVVIVPRDAEKRITDLQILKCEAPKVLRIAGGAGGGVIEPSAAPPTSEPEPVAMRIAKECGTEAGLEVKAKADATAFSISIPTLPLHRITVGLGVFFDLSRPSTVAARPLKGESVPVLTQTRSIEGLATAAMVAIRPLRVDTVRRRDRFWEIVAPSFGVSLTDPKDHLYLAINIEPFPGLGLLVGYHAFREEILADGYASGDRYPSGTLPVVKRWRWWGEGGLWKEPQVFIGLNADSSLLVDLLAALNR
jgi:hypothetical protein